MSKVTSEDIEEAASTFEQHLEKQMGLPTGHMKGVMDRRKMQEELDERPLPSGKKLVDIYMWSRKETLYEFLLFLGQQKPMVLLSEDRPWGDGVPPLLDGNAQRALVEKFLSQ